MKGLDLLTYDTAMQGSVDGPVIVPGDPDASLLIQVQSGEKQHFGQFTEEELQNVWAWIAAGAPEN